MTEEAQQFINELNKEIIITHTATASRLLKKGKVGVDAFTLYNFYCWVASWQLTNKVKATDKFCIQGLHWGKPRFIKAKTLLIKEGVIKTIAKKDEKGRIIGHYIHIHYLNGFTLKRENPEVLSNTSGQKETRGIVSHQVENRPTSALDKKENALDKKSMSVEPTDLKKEKNRKNTPTLKPKDTSVLWDLKKETEKLLKDPKRHIQIIGLWIQEKGLQPENAEQMQSLIKRNLRPACLLNGYSNEDIRETIKILKNTEYLKKFTLETCLKYIDEVVAQKKKQGRQIIRFEEIKRPDGSIVVRPIYAEVKT